MLLPGALHTHGGIVTLSQQPFISHISDYQTRFQCCQSSGKILETSGIVGGNLSYPDLSSNHHSAQLIEGINILSTGIILIPHKDISVFDILGVFAYGIHVILYALVGNIAVLSGKNTLQDRC